jgi:hypothetical protein
MMFSVFSWKCGAAVPPSCINYDTEEREKQVSNKNSGRDKLTVINDKLNVVALVSLRYVALVAHRLKVVEVVASTLGVRENVIHCDDYSLTVLALHPAVNAAGDASGTLLAQDSLTGLRRDAVGGDRDDASNRHFGSLGVRVVSHRPGLP